MFLPFGSTTKTTGRPAAQLSRVPSPHAIANSLPVLGDQSVGQAPPRKFVTWRRCEPSAFIVSNWPKPVPPLVQKASLSPLGDHTGLSPSTSRFGFAVAGSWMKISYRKGKTLPCLISKAIFFTTGFAGGWAFED